MKKIYCYAICELKNKPIDLLRWGVVLALTQRQAMRNVREYYKEKKNDELKISDMDILVWYDNELSKNIVEFH